MQLNERSITNTPAQRTTRERIGLMVFGTDASAIVSTIVAAEKAGVQQVWVTQGTPEPDALTIFAAAAALTSNVRMGTAIIPTYPRHPLALAQQLLTLHDLAPGRVLVGIGPSQRPVIEGIFGIPIGAPLEHLREYVTVLRAILGEDNVDYHGRFYTVKTRLPRLPRTPILTSALRQGAFRLAGELADGALTWLCPVPYLLQDALPAMRAGAEEKGRLVPPLMAHIPVVFGQDRQTVRALVRTEFDSGRFFGRLSFYARMFADAGFPVASDGSWSDEFIDNMVVSGDEATIAARLRELLDQGLDELVVMPIPRTDPISQTRLIQLIGQL
ncbi:LLM class F420-dependent oxidoreductase [Reticulibacter mediterranei]|uniref:LLM class F420-dependent oxidoreductase n=1 Tax=Reticulibacter mediterranei TaxID=2778369 RepID=A0A8J3IHR2_9CHLR|nr:LLM class flavin-dependent oxidoreductase [Reticulibacter mediterranei]GHO92698.1 LLM class F420-dependent oxidoreductase [Reticulibacter mediterranei]